MYLDAHQYILMCARACGVRFTGFGTISYMALTGPAWISRCGPVWISRCGHVCVRNPTRDQCHVCCSCYVFLLLVLSRLSFPHSFPIHGSLGNSLGSTSRMAPHLLGLLRSRWYLVLSISTSASSAVALCRPLCAGIVRDFVSEHARSLYRKPLAWCRA